MLPVRPPIPPMLARLARELPAGEGWLFEPKWDGFRAIAFWDGEELYLQSRDLKPLGRYFPELEEALPQVLPEPMAVDGEIVIAGPEGLDFEALLMRIHPAASRVRLLAEQTPASFVAFDLLATAREDLTSRPLLERRQALEELLARVAPPVFLTPATGDRDLAEDWFRRFEGAGLDGVVAKRLDEVYQPAQRVMVKVKHQRTADCVVAGFRWARDGKGKSVGSLLLGLYDESGSLQYVGHTSSFTRQARQELVALLQPYRDEAGEGGFGHGRAPGGPSRWTQGRDLSWEPLRPELVCEVAFDHLQGTRFRHGTTFLRWRPDKQPRDCTYEPLDTPVPYELGKIFGS